MLCIQFCHRRSDTVSSRPGRFLGFLTIPSDEQSVMEALALHGPLAVSFDAGDKSFK
jgi:hypothetical protein